MLSIPGIYKHLLSDRKFGLTHNLIATKVMPPLIPQTVNPGLTMEQVRFIYCPSMPYYGTSTLHFEIAPNKNYQFRSY